MTAESQPRPPAPVYRLISLLLAPLWAMHAIKHGWQHDLAAYLPMRLFAPGGSAAERIWVHASSVGEVRAVAPLVQSLVDAGEQVVFTSFTATGYQAIRRQFEGVTGHGVIPIDNWVSCRLFFRRRSIRLGLIMETELWPELLYQARRHGVELLLINARLSSKSLDTPGFVRRLLTTTLAYFERILTRNRVDLDALTRLGADAGRIRIIGNLKSRGAARRDHPRLVARDYLLLASSHRGEEAQFLRGRSDSRGDCLLVLAPRHPRRGPEIERELESLGLRYAVRSRQQAVADDTEVYLADTLGELAALMAHARIVVMGGSFDQTGGHNLIEAASLGRAILTGPSDANIAADIAMLGDGHGLLQVGNMAQCWQRIDELLADPGRAEALGREALARLQAQPDVVEAYLDELRPFLARCH